MFHATLHTTTMIPQARVIKGLEHSGRRLDLCQEEKGRRLTEEQLLSILMFIDYKIRVCVFFFALDFRKFCEVLIVSNPGNFTCSEIENKDV